jgi:methyltransferase family protein
MNLHVTTIETTEANSLSGKIKAALTRAVVGDGKLSPEVFAIEGMSGKKYRLFINNLIESIEGARYLEIGVWQGSTLCAAIFKNKVRALAIDNWSLFAGPADKFFKNLARFKGSDTKLSFFENDFREINFFAIGKFNIYLFDGPHDAQDQRDGIILAQPALDDRFVMIVDDWNWAVVRDGTLRGIEEAHLQLDHVVEIRTSLDDTQPDLRGAASDWHNGYFIAACSKCR